MAGTAVAVSAPGKVLLAGGYLVLDRAYTGLVFGLAARIHVLVEPISSTSGVVFSEITVKSPQFRDAVWEYGYRWAERDAGIQITQLRVDADLDISRNPFVETTLCYALSYIASLSSPAISPAAVTILADNDYYSTPADLVEGADGKPERFHNFGVPLSQANKTGLGSSAALVTALTAALLAHYLPKDVFDMTTDSGRRRLHNLAQAAHCAAQGKVGSGFDVASAVYGSCLYRRFSPSILSSRLEPGLRGFSQQLRETVDESRKGGEWDTEMLKDEVKIPDGLALLMCDVSCGSQTPGMVKKVLAWRQEKPEEAEQIWTDLHAANQQLSQEMKRLAESTTKMKGSDNDYAGLSACFAAIRKNIRRMSAKSGVPIEPPSQTALIDACELVPGVIGGTVPGAGGYDAIALLVEDNSETLNALKSLLKTWKFEDATEDGVKGGKVSLLGVKQDMEGARTEELRSYEAYRTL